MHTFLEENLAILVVEDNQGDADLIEATLEGEFLHPPRLVYVTTLRHAMAEAAGSEFDVVLLDLGLPDGQGVDCVEAIRSVSDQAPIVVLTGNEDVALAMTCISSGAQDYLAKRELRSHHLVRAIGYAIARKRAVALQVRGLELEQQNVRMREINRLKSEFVAGMSHELRTPLNAIIGFGELLRAGMVPPDSKNYYKFIGHICVSGKHLLNLVNDILDLAKLEAGKIEFRPELINLIELVAEVVEVSQGMMLDYQTQISVVHDDSLTEVLMDPVRFKQIIYNLVSNAIKFSPKGGYIRVSTVAEDSHYFRLEVEDCGIGIAADDLPRLFTEFQQIMSAPSGRTLGTGLGLALTKRLVDAQGGRVGVRSIPGHGSMFYAVLPRYPTSISPEAG